MTHQQTKVIYHTMPANYRKHGDMPAQRDMYDDVESFMQTASLDIIQPVAEKALRY